MPRSAAPRLRRLACILLAAGGSHRLGYPKQLLRRRGQPLLVRALTATRLAAPHCPIVVVLGAQALRLRLVVRRAAPQARAVHNTRWTEGLATSLQAGLAAVPADIKTVLVTLVDQPDVNARSLRRLLRAWRRRPGAAAAARYAGRAGVPAVLPRRYWPVIRTLRGDNGARALLRGLAPTLVDLPEAALDIDTPADRARLR